MVLLTDCMISVQWNCLGLETRPSHLDCNCVIWRKVPYLSMLLQIIPVNEEDMGPSWPQSLCSFLLYYAPPDSMTGESLGCLTRNQKNYDKFQLHGDTRKCSVYNYNFDFSSENNFLKKLIYTSGLINARNVLLSALLCCSFVALVVQLPSCIYLWPYGLQHTWLPCPSPFPGLLKLTSIESVMLSNHLILSHPLLLLLSIFPSIWVFSNELALRIRWPKYWSFSFSISPSREYSGLISFRIDSFDLLAVQGTLKSHLQQFKSINSSALSFLYSPTLTSIHDYWKNHSCGYTDICWQSNVSAF